MSGRMPIESKIDKSMNLTTYTLSGVVTAHDLMSALESFFKENPTPNVLWDLRHAGFEKGMRNSDLQRMARFSKRKQPSKTRGKTAIVATSDLAFGLAREFEAFAEIEGVKNPIEVFRSMSKAEKWLESGTDKSP